MAAAAPPGPPANFLQYLQQEIRVPRGGMRDKIHSSGFEVDLYNKDDNFTHRVCQQIRKTPTGMSLVFRKIGSGSLPSTPSAVTLAV